MLGIPEQCSPEFVSWIDGFISPTHLASDTDEERRDRFTSGLHACRERARGTAAACFSVTGGDTARASGILTRLAEASRPTLYRALTNAIKHAVHDTGLLGSVPASELVDQSLAATPPTPMLARTVVAPAVAAGRPLDPGTVVIALLAATPRSRELPFGHGPRGCLGRNAAAAVLATGLEALAGAPLGITPAAPPTPLPEFAFHGWTSIPASIGD